MVSHSSSIPQMTWKRTKNESWVNQSQGVQWSMCGYNGTTTMASLKGHTKEQEKAYLKQHLTNKVNMQIGGAVSHTRD